MFRNGSHWKGSHHCFLSNESVSWRGLNDIQKKNKFTACSTCGGNMIELKGASNESCRYWQCENYVGCRLPENGCFDEQSKLCDCDAPVHDCILLAFRYPLPKTVAECEPSEHVWEYEKQFEGDYEGPSFMAPYGDRRWCSKCARPEVKPIETVKFTERVSGVGIVRLLKYLSPSLHRSCAAWDLDKRMVRHCSECDDRWYQIFGGSTDFVCPSCSAWQATHLKGYQAGSKPPPVWTIVGKPRVPIKELQEALTQV